MYVTGSTDTLALSTKVWRQKSTHLVRRRRYVVLSLNRYQTATRSPPWIRYADKNHWDMRVAAEMCLCYLPFLKVERRAHKLCRCPKSTHVNRNSSDMHIMKTFVCINTRALLVLAGTAIIYAQLTWPTLHSQQENCRFEATYWLHFLFTYNSPVRETGWFSR